MNPNPFKPTAGKRPPILIGRESVIEDFEEGLDNGAGAPGRLMLITGNRGYGKTVLLRELQRLASERGWAVVSDSASLGLCDRLADALRSNKPVVTSMEFGPSFGRMSVEAALYRKSILDKIGVFDELFFAYYEDVDLSWRANNFGYKNVYCPTARCRHICGATTGAVRYNPFKSIQSGRNSILLPYKNQPLLMMLLNLIPMVLGYLLKVVMFRFRGFGNDYAKGFHEAWVALPKLNKPKFHWKNLPNYIWVECSLIVGLFRYLIYRIQRALKVT